MKTIIKNLTLASVMTLGLTLAVAVLPTSAQAQDGPVFELRTYKSTPGNLDKLMARFRDHTMRIFEKHGMTNIGYWMPTDEV